MRSIGITAWALIQFGVIGWAQQVSKVTASQEGQRIVVQYQLQTPEPCEVELYCSEDGGQQWKAVKGGLSGDQHRQASGVHRLEWDVLQGREEMVSDQVVFKVKAISTSGGYKTVTIGDQVWMAENLNVDRYRNGDLIKEVKEDNQWYVTYEGAWCYYNNELSNGEIYGKLYNWYAVNDGRGLCPVGWHVPSDEDWTALEDYYEGADWAGGYLKATQQWMSPNTDANNESGFGALPGGYRNGWGVNGDLGKDGFWWTADALNSSEAWDRTLSYKDGEVGRSANRKTLGFSVRCIKD